MREQAAVRLALAGLVLAGVGGCGDSEGPRRAEPIRSGRAAAPVGGVDPLTGPAKAIKTH